MKLYTLSLLMLLTVGCNGVKRLVDGPEHQPMPQQNNINQNDFYLTGKTAVDNDVVYTNVTGRSITIEVKRPQDADYVTLKAGKITEGNAFGYILFVKPSQGIRFWNDVVPANSLYRIHSVAQ